MSDYDTKPTIETIMNGLLRLEHVMQAGFAAINERLDAIETRLDRLERKLDRQDERIDNFIEEVIDMKRKLRRPA